MNLLRRTLSTALVGGLLAATAGAEGSVRRGAVSGIVRAQASPISEAQVYAYRIEDLKLTQVLSDLKGKFRFEDLPSGLYQVIAYKSGFVPAIIRITRPSEAKSQYLDVELVEQQAGDVRSGEAYWDLLHKVPDDVLRQIRLAEAQRLGAPGFQLDLPPGSELRASFEAGGGVDDIGTMGDAQRSGAGVDLEGRLAGMDFDLAGDFWNLTPADVEGAEGKTSAVSFSLKAPSDGELAFSSSNSRLVTDPANASDTVGLDTYQLSWSQQVDEKSRYRLAVRHTDERNFYRNGPIEPTEVPEASSVWQAEASYQRELSDRSSIETGVLYRERAAQGTHLREVTGAIPLQPLERVDLYGRGGYRVRPAVLLEYGVYTVMRNGELALAPQGGVVFQVSPQWQAAAQVSGRVADQSTTRSQDFLPSLYQDSDSSCEANEELCYRVLLTRQEGDGLISVGASHREFGETARLAFSEDFFDQRESLYLVQGDKIPEFEIAVGGRLSSSVLARLESNLAAGGGGLLYAGDSLPYENEVRYLVTSVDTRFQNTATGVFLGFHYLMQELSPLDESSPEVAQLESERLQLRLTQGLSELLRLPADWALQLDMQLSRGTFQGADEDDDEIRRRLLGGIAVRF